MGRRKLGLKILLHTYLTSYCTNLGKVTRQTWCTAGGNWPQMRYFIVISCITWVWSEFANVHDMKTGFHSDCKMGERERTCNSLHTNCVFKILYLKPIHALFFHSNKSLHYMIAVCIYEWAPLNFMGNIIWSYTNYFILCNKQNSCYTIIITYSNNALFIIT